MDAKREYFSPTLLQDSSACHREAHALRIRLEELMAAPIAETGLEPGAIRGGHAAMLAVTVLGAATAQKIVGLAHWLRRIADCMRSARQYSECSSGMPVDGSTTTCSSPQLAGNSRWKPFESESSDTEDECLTDELTEDDEPTRVSRPCTNPIGVNLYLYMEDALAQAAEGLMNMPALSGTITEGLIAIGGVEVGLCQAEAEHREALARLLGAPAVQEPLQVTTVYAVEESAAELCKVAHRVLRAVHRGVALMQVALDGVQASAERRAQIMGMDHSPSGRGDGGGGDDDVDMDEDVDEDRPRCRNPALQRRLIRTAAADCSGLLLARMMQQSAASRAAAAARLNIHLAPLERSGEEILPLAVRNAATRRLKVNLKVKFIQRQMED